jgi:hypothetical protein
LAGIAPLPVFPSLTEHRVLLGVICGLIFGALDIGIMLPMSFPDKKAAITAAFIARFGIGFAIGEPVCLGPAGRLVCVAACS